jgi:hypothetical protein
MAPQGSAAYRRVVTSAVRRLEELGDSLSPGPQLLPEMVAPWSLLQRAHSLLDAILWLLDGPSDAAVHIVARSLVDLAITVAWLRLDPDTNVRLWSAEQWRRELEQLPYLDRRIGPLEDQESLNVLEMKRSVVDRARTLALSKGIAGVGQRGPLVPTLRARADAVGTQATGDAYGLLFTYWSEWGHTGSGSLSVDSDGTRVTFDDGPPKNVVGACSMACAVYAYVLAELSRWIGLGIEAECDELREGLVRAEPPVAPGYQ